MPSHEPTSELHRERTVAPAADLAAPHGVVDYRRTARRLRAGGCVVAVAVLGTWLLRAATATATLRLLADLAGLGLLALLGLEVIIVGGAAVRGMLAAGDRGERLAGGDVSLLPPQLSRRARR